MKRPDGSDIDPEKGVVITQKLADMCDLSEGDSISFTDPDGDRYKAEIGGIMQNYALNYIFMTDAQYEKAFGKKPQDNIALLNTDNSASNESVKSELISDERVLGVTFKDDSAKSFMRSIKSMNAIVLLLIVLKTPIRTFRFVILMEAISCGVLYLLQVLGILANSPVSSMMKIM